MSSVLVSGDWELDFARFELRREGERVDVQPKALRVLFHLASNRERSVSAAELLEAIWPGEAVTPASVKRAVRGARRALGESGESPSTIRTVRGHGYQFVRAVSEVDVSDAESRAPNGEGNDVFVGRDGVIAALDAVLAETRAGRGRCVLVAGEAGIGKTRVLRELARRAAGLGSRAWFARCMEINGAPGFWPLIQILREANATCSTTELCALLGPGAADVAEAVPELAQWLPGLESAPRIGSESARFRFFDSMTLFLKRAAERRPLVLLFDDLERADQPTLRFLAFLLRQIDSSPVLVAGAVRSFANRNPSVAALVADLAKEPCARSIELQGLTPHELGAYFEAKLSRPVGEAMIASLHEQTAGNPLFAEQLVDGLRVGLEKGTRSGGLRGAIERHLDGLGKACRETLERAAVLGREFSVGLLSHMVDAPGGLVLEHLEEAAVGGIVRPLPGSAAAYRFVHALIHDALYDQLPLSERARLHGRAGAALEASGAAASDDVLPKLAEHFSLAAPDHDGGRALKYAVLAAQAAAERLAYEAAVVHLDRALGILEFSPADPQRRLALLLAKGEALVHTGDIAAARAPLFEAMKLALDRAEPDAMVRAARGLAATPEAGWVDTRLVTVLRDAVRLLPEGDPRAACLQALTAKSLSYSGDLEQCAALGRAALEHGRTLDDPALRADVLQCCLDSLAAPEHRAERVAIVEELVGLSHERGDLGILMRALTTRIWNCVEVGDMHGVDVATGQLEALVERAREPRFRWQARLFRAMRAGVQGRLVLAEQLAREALELGRPMGEAVAHHAYVVQVSGWWRLQGRLAEARALVSDISAQHPLLGGWRAALASIDAELGERKHAREVLEQLVDRDLAALRREPFLLSALAPAAELCALVGDLAIAKVLYAAILPHETRHGNVAFGLATHGPMSRHLGMLAARMGDFERADRHYQLAIEASLAMPSPVMTSLCCALRAHALLQNGSRESRELMAQSLGRACELADEHGLRAVSALCRRLAEKACVRLRKRSLPAA